MTEPLIRAPVLRLRQGRAEPADDLLAEEIPVALVYNGISHVVMMATPQDLPELALGFSLSEGILRSAAELYGLELQERDNGIEVQMDIASARFQALKARRRSLNGRTGCGLCGVDSLAAALPALPPLGYRLYPSAAEIDAALAEFDRFQPLRARCGALHAAAWVENGRIQTAFEDVGRHNALDKLLGSLVRRQTDLRRGWVLVSSRASYEMAAKTATLGIACLAAVSAPTALAVRMAEACGLTLIGFAREGRQTVYTPFAADR